MSKSVFAMKMNLIPKEPQMTSWHHVSDSLVNTGESADEDKAGDHSLMLTELEQSGKNIRGSKSYRV